MCGFWTLCRNQLPPEGVQTSSSSPSSPSSSSSGEVHGKTVSAQDHQSRILPPKIISEPHVAANATEHVGKNSEIEPQEEQAGLGAIDYCSFPAPIFHTGGKPRALDSRTYPEYSPDRPRNPSSAHHTHAWWHPHSPEASPERANTVYRDGKEIPRNQLPMDGSRPLSSFGPSPSTSSAGFFVDPPKPAIPHDLSQRLASHPKFPGPTRSRQGCSSRRGTQSSTIFCPIVHQPSIQINKDAKLDHGVVTAPSPASSQLHLRGGLAKKRRLADDEHIPRLLWFLVDGRGPPPTAASARATIKKHKAKELEKQAERKTKADAKKTAKETGDQGAVGEVDAEQAKGFLKKIFKRKKGKKEKNAEKDGGEGGATGGSDEAPEAT